jgi:hypothetical protein
MIKRLSVRCVSKSMSLIARNMMLSPLISRQAPSFNATHNLKQLANCSTASGVTAPASRKKSKSTSIKVSDSEPSFDFNDEITSILQKVNEAVLPMKALNDPFEINLDMDTPQLLIETKHGDFSITVNFSRNLLLFHSYITGKHEYAFEPVEKVWLSIRDEHDFRGLLIRDMIRHLNGCPLTF